jgi:Kef-type K+ transport system membrane component KefB
MPTVSFSGVLVIALVAVAVRGLGALAPRLPVPGAVLEVVAGIVIGPAVLGWVLLPLLKDTGQHTSTFGQLVMTAGVLAEVASVVLLSLLFSAASPTAADRIISLITFLALLAVRAVPALLYVRLIGRRRAIVAGLMQATTLTFVIVAAQLGVATGQLSQTSAASLLAAGLLSAALFPALALQLLPTRRTVREPIPLETAA